MLLLATLCQAASLRIDLPPGEDAGAWASALASAGFVAVEAEADVVVAAVGERWRLTARDAAGQTRVTEVAAPHDAGARASVAWLAASLVRPGPSVASRLAPARVDPPVEAPAPPAASQPPARMSVAPASTSRGGTGGVKPVSTGVDRGSALGGAPTPPTPPAPTAPAGPVALGGSSEVVPPPADPGGPTASETAPSPAVGASVPGDSVPVAGASPAAVASTPLAAPRPPLVDLDAVPPAPPPRLHVAASVGTMVRGALPLAPSAGIAVGVEARPFTVAFAFEPSVAVHPADAADGATARVTRVLARGGWRRETRWSPVVSIEAGVHLWVVEGVGGVQRAFTPVVAARGGVAWQALPWLAVEADAGIGSDLAVVEFEGATSPSSWFVLPNVAIVVSR